MCARSGREGHARGLAGVPQGDNAPGGPESRGGAQAGAAGMAAGSAAPRAAWRPVPAPRAPPLACALSKGLNDEDQNPMLDLNV